MTYIVLKAPLNSNQPTNLWNHSNLTSVFVQPLIGSQGQKVASDI